MPKANASTALVERSSGIMVPDGLAAEPDRSAPTKTGKFEPPVCYDPDGRRRLVLPKRRQKEIDKLLGEMVRLGAGFVVICVETFMRDGKPGCGQPMINEGRGTDDGGYGCKCTRIHFQG